LREQGKSKRSLSQFLNIHENGINRVLGSPTVGIDKLKLIAEFLDMEFLDLLTKLCYQSETSNLEGNREPDKRIVSDKLLDSNEKIILLLSEVVQEQKKITESNSSNR
jgi:hypothetical protein